jgi:hypothetical protein
MALASSSATRMIFMGVTLFAPIRLQLSRLTSTARIARGSDRDDPLHADDLEIGNFIHWKNFVLS